MMKQAFCTPTFSRFILKQRDALKHNPLTWQFHFYSRKTCAHGYKEMCNYERALNSKHWVSVNVKYEFVQECSHDTLCNRKNWKKI